MATFDLTKLASRNINKFLDLITWTEQNVGPHVMKGQNHAIIIYDGSDKTVTRAFGLGWHLDYETMDFCPFKRTLTIYDELKAMLLKLTFEIE